MTTLIRLAWVLGGGWALGDLAARFAFWVVA